MARVRITDCRNAAPMARCGQPIANLRADQTAPRFAGARWTAGYDQQKPHVVGDGPFEGVIERGVCGRQRVAMQVDRAVGRNRSLEQAPVPMAVERIARPLPFGVGPTNAGIQDSSRS